MTAAKRTPAKRAPAKKARDTGGWRARLLELSRHQDLAVLVAILAIAGLIWLFLEVGGEVIEGETTSFDEAVVVATRNPTDPSRVIGPPIVTEMMRDLTALGSLVVITGMVVLISGFLLLAKKFRALIAVLVASGGGALLTQLLKNAYHRPRPSVVPHLAVVDSPSFPSGHSMLAAVVYLTLASMSARLVERQALRVYIIGTGALLALLVGVSRVMLGVHYPTDVVAGWILGLAWAIGCWILMRALQRRDIVEPPEPET